MPRDPLALTADALRAPLAAALETAQHLARAGAPTAYVAVHAGDDAAALAGFAKALAREWPAARVASIAVDAARSGAVIAEQLAAELAGTDATVEVSYAAGERRVIELVRAEPGAARALRDGAVVAITGGARGLGAKLALELARTRRAKLILLGRAARDARVDELAAAIAAAGGEAMYVACDVRDAAAVDAALAEGRRRFGPIEAVVHAAGVIADAPIAKKDLARAAEVFDTKAGGWVALARATREDPVAVAVALGSWSGRFGNAEQTDYAAANHLLAVLAAAWHRARPETRAVVLDLPPWDGSGMASTIPAGLRAMMRARGVTFLDDATGLALVTGELGAAGASELVVGHAPATEREDRARLRLALDTHPYLGDHRLDGVPVLPLAAAADYALAAARRLARGPVVLAELELLDGVRLTGAQLLLDVRARAEQRAGAQGEIDREIEVELASPEGKLYYRARAVPAPRIEAVATLDRPAALEPPPLAVEEFYARHTFHGPLLRGIVKIDGLDARTLVGTVRAARPGELGAPLASFVLDPLLVDSSFQLAAYFMLVRHKRAGLPLGFDELRVLAPVPHGAPITCIVRLEAQSGDLFAGHIDYLDAAGALVAQLRGVRGAFKPVEGLALRPTSTPQPQPAPQPQPQPQAQVARLDGEIDPGNYDPAKFPEYVLLRERIDKVKKDGIALPYFHVQERITNDTTQINGREMINFSAYNYVGMSGDPVVTRAAIEAIEKFGTSVSASRIASGEKPLHGELERELARFLGTEDAIVMVGGHSTNVGVIGHIMRAGDLVVHDSLAHDSILQGIKLSGARRRPFPHNDWKALDELLTNVRGSFNRVLIAIEGVYSMDGDIPDLPRFIEIKKKHKAMLLVDEAHSLGVLGKRGAGIGEHFGVDRKDVEMWMGTMSKTLASCGGYIAGSHALVEYLKYTAPGFVYSVGLSPPNAAAALASLRQLEAHPERVATIAARAKYFLALCKERGLDTGLAVGTAVVPCIVGSSTRCMRLAEALGKRGINVQPIIYPAVEDHLARLRFFMTCTHTEEQLRYTADVLAIELAKLDPAYIIPPSVRVSDQRGPTDAARSRPSFIRKITGRTVER